MAASFAVRAYVVSGTEWVPIVTPFECHRIVIENASADTAMGVRGNDGGTEAKAIRYGGEELNIDHSARQVPGGHIVCFCKGGGPAIVTFTL